jgi:hypothetical protein
MVSIGRLHGCMAVSMRNFTVPTRSAPSRLPRASRGCTARRSTSAIPQPSASPYAEIPYDQVTPEQQEGYDAMIEARGRLPGPTKFWVHNPKLAKVAGPFGAHFQLSRRCSGMSCSDTMCAAGERSMKAD